MSSATPLPPAQSAAQTSDAAAAASAVRKAAYAEMCARAMARGPPGVAHIPDYTNGPVLYRGGSTHEGILAASPDAPVYGYISLSSDRDVFDEENPHTGLRLYDLQIFFAVYPDKSVGITRILLRAYKHAGQPREEQDVDLLNLYGPWCLLRKHNIHTSNLMLDAAWDEVWDDEDFPEEERVFATSPRIVAIFTKIAAVLTAAETRAAA